jgi:hypothetical protein
MLEIYNYLYIHHFNSIGKKSLAMIDVILLLNDMLSPIKNNIKNQHVLLLNNAVTVRKRRQHNRRTHFFIINSMPLSSLLAVSSKGKKFGY